MQISRGASQINQSPKHPNRNPVNSNGQGNISLHLGYNFQMVKWSADKEDALENILKEVKEVKINSIRQNKFCRILRAFQADV